MYLLDTVKWLLTQPFYCVLALRPIHSFTQYRIDQFAGAVVGKDDETSKLTGSLCLYLHFCSRPFHFQKSSGWMWNVGGLLCELD